MKVINFLSRLATYIAFVAVCLIMILTVTDVFMRYVFNIPVTGSTELVEFLMVILILGVVPAALENRHITVDVLMERLTPKGRAFFDSITLFSGMLLVAIMGWRALVTSLFMISNDVRSPTLDISIYPFYIIVSVGFILLFISMIAIFVKKVTAVLKA